MNELFPAAERLAAEDGIEEPGVEHLLLVAIDLEDGIAKAALNASGIEPADLRAAIAEQHDDALRSIGVVADDGAITAALPPPRRLAGPYRAQGSLQVSFQRAVALAKRDASALTSGHVLLAATEAEHGTVARALAHLGVDRAVLTRDARRLIGRDS